MNFTVFVATASLSVCSNNTLGSAARAVLLALTQSNFSCLRSVMSNPDLKFNGAQLDPSVYDSLTFEPPGRRSYFNIVRGGVLLDFVRSGATGTVFFIDKKYYEKYSKNKQLFKKQFFMRKYFSCNFQLVDSKWYLTEDLCFTEGEF